MEASRCGDVMTCEDAGWMREEDAARIMDPGGIAELAAAYGFSPSMQPRTFDPST